MPRAGGIALTRRAPACPAPPARRAPPAGRARRVARRCPRSALVMTRMSGTSMIPAFRNCSASPAAGLDDHGHRVGRLGHVGLRLADADGLDHHDVERVGQRLRGRPRGRGEPAEPLPGGHRADEHAAVGGVVLDPRAVAQQRAAGALGGRVDGQHGHAELARPPLAQQRREQRGLARAGRPGDADDVARAVTGGGHERGRLLALRAVLEQVERRRRRRAVAGAAAGPPSSLAGHAGDGVRCAPRRARRCRA